MKKLFHIPINPASRVFGLDLFRAIAIGGVLLSHCRTILHSSSDKVDYFRLGGFFGVELFFVLSGFLIGTIILKIYAANIKFSFADLKEFWIRRWFRTLPAYYLILAVSIVVAIATSTFYELSTKEYLSYLFFLQNSSSLQPSFFEVSWSLCIEEWFYLTFPLGLFIISLILPSKIAKKTKFLLWLIFLSVFYLLLRLYVVNKYNPDWDAGIRRIMPLRLDSILYGVGVAYINFYYRDFFVKYARIAFYIGLCISLSVVYLYYTDVLAAGRKDATFFSKVFLFVIIDVAFALMLPAATFLKYKKSIFSNIVIRISLVSYSIYLINVFFKQIFTKLSIKVHNEFVGITLLFSFWIIVILVASLMYKYYEHPLTQLREKFKKRKANQDSNQKMDRESLA